MDITKCKVYQPIRVEVEYKKSYPWKIPIKVVRSKELGVAEIRTVVNSEVLKIGEFGISERVADIVRYYSSHQFTKGLIPFVGEKIHLRVSVENGIFEHLGEDTYGLPFRGVTREFFPEASVELSWPACKLITERLGSVYQKQKPELARKRDWTPKGWVIHALTHELAHLIVVGKTIKGNISEITSEIFAARYGADKARSADKDVIYVAAGDYLKRHWGKLGIDPNDSALCSRLLKEALEEPY